ncbi:FAR1-domain family sequence [Striga asiatica]|uniref:FAR1-domain family sequence n=1 Tax=Striga asiatica TaxID=4170 RepID=A0A5A7PM86_STRAF|nr:FAR1-domain family sequence [Striga asiatica]
MEIEQEESFIPQVDSLAKPLIGQEFQSAEKALCFYNEYAKVAGFSTKIKNSQKDTKADTVVGKMFACSKEGKTNVSYRNKRGTVAETKARKRGETLGESLHSRRGALMKITKKLIDDASLTEARSKFLMEKLKVLKWEVGEIDEKECMSKRLSNDKGEETFIVCDPEPIRTKGCGKRLKSSKEKAISQSARSCSLCGQKGHDKRKCPIHSIHLEDDPYRPNIILIVANDDSFGALEIQ